MAPCTAHDWEAVITPVIDFLVARDDVDPQRVALHGISQAGYWVPRAAAFEHRLAAVVADPGVVDVAESWEKHLPPEMAQLLDDGDKESFDAFMEVGLEKDPEARAELRWRMAPLRNGLLLRRLPGGSTAEARRRDDRRDHEPDARDRSRR
ncbi:MAG: hypothetical protein R3A49_12470 [Acidimicrobiia bacterium]